MSRRVLARQIDLGGAQRRDNLRGGLRAVLDTIGTPAPAGASSAELLAALEAALQGGEHDRVWLALAVLSGRLPLPEDVLRVARTARLDGPLRALTPTLLRGGRRAVRIVQDEVVVDLHDTAATSLETGIQRVVRQTASRWYRDHTPRLVRWDPSLTSLVELSAAEREDALMPGRRREPVQPGFDAVVPWRCTYLVPELAAERPRTRRLHALMAHSGSRGGFIGHDCVPISAGETVATGMGARFAGMLSAAAHASTIAAVSQASAGEFRGWRAMLPGTGLTGPEVVAVPLPVQTEPATADGVAWAHQVAPEGVPLVLCVGSHEPRKNHLAVLHAAERLWSEGLEFVLVLVGGNSWRSHAFTARAEELLGRGRSIELMRGLDDERLSGLYAIARCTIFPSLSEGFGLPVGESLAAGTPVITSRFGSMREIADAGGGALLVDPRDDDDVTGALRRLLTDDDLHAELAAQARTRPPRDWDDYAAQTWAALVDP